MTAAPSVQPRTEVRMPTGSLSVITTVLGSAAVISASPMVFLPVPMRRQRSSEATTSPASNVWPSWKGTPSRNGIVLGEPVGTDTWQLGSQHRLHLAVGVAGVEVFGDVRGDLEDDHGGAGVRIERRWVAGDGDPEDTTG